MMTVFFTDVVGNLNRNKGTIRTSGKAYTNLVPYQNSIYSGGQHTLAFYTKNHVNLSVILKTGIMAY